MNNLSALIPAITGLVVAVTGLVAVIRHVKGPNHPKPKG